MEFAAGERERTPGPWHLVRAHCGVNDSLRSREAGQFVRRALAGMGAWPRGVLGGGRDLPGDQEKLERDDI